MGPRSHERGNKIYGEFSVPTAPASMGPRSHERGNGSGSVTAHSSIGSFNGAAFLMNAETWLATLLGHHSELLQWGRVLMNAETPRRATGAVPLALLQWGRVLMNAETRSFETPVGQRVMWLQWGRVLMNAETLHG